MTLKGRAFSGPPPARLDLEPASRGESIKPRVERSGTLLFPFISDLGAAGNVSRGLNH